MKHVQRFYQNNLTVPGSLRTLNRVGIFDYVGYTFDSTRIAIEGTKFAVEQARQGNMIPALGFMASKAIPLAFVLPAGVALKRVVAGVLDAVKQDDEDDEELMERDQETDFRMFLPDYYARSLGVFSTITKKDGTKELTYTIMSGKTAFPIDDFLAEVVVAMQDGRGLGLSGQEVAQFAMGMLGMYPERVRKTLTGQDFDPATPDRRDESIEGAVGVFQAGIEDERRNEIISDVLLQHLGDVYLPGQAGKLLRRANYSRNLIEGGADPDKVATPFEVLQETTALNRTYRVDETFFKRMLRGKLTPLMNVYERDRSAARRPQRQKRDTGGKSAPDVETARLAASNMGGIAKQMANLIESARKGTPKEWMSNAEYVNILTEMGMDKDSATKIVLGRPELVNTQRFIKQPIRR